MNLFPYVLALLIIAGIDQIALLVMLFNWPEGK